MRKMLYGIPNMSGGTAPTPDNTPMPTRIVASGWRNTWRGPEPAGHVVVGRLVPGVDSGGMALYDAVIFRELGTQDFKIGVAGRLMPMRGPLPPVVQNENDPVE